MARGIVPLAEILEAHDAAEGSDTAEMEDSRTSLLFDDDLTHPLDRIHAIIVMVSAAVVAGLLEARASELAWWLGAVWLGAGAQFLSVVVRHRTPPTWSVASRAAHLGSTVFTGFAWASLLTLDPTNAAPVQAIVLIGAVAPTASAVFAQGGRSDAGLLFPAALWGSATVIMLAQSQLQAAGLTAATWIATSVATRAASRVLERAAADRRSLREMRRELATARATDPLTGLLDRRSTLGSVRGATETGHAVGILCIDLDDFGFVNERFGHAAGDQVLINVAVRLAEITRADDVVGRIGNDEFVVVLTDPADLHLTDVIADRVAGEIARSHGPIDELSITASVGSVISVDGLSAEDLLGCAETAMIRAKQNGGNAAETFLARNSS